MTAEKKRRRAIIIAGAALVLALVAGGGWHYLENRDPLRGAAARAASAALGVPVTIGRLTVDAPTGNVVAADIRIANPPGFGGGPAITIAQIRMDAAPGGPPLSFSTVSVTGAVIALAVQPQASNLSVLRRGVNPAASAPAAPGDPAPPRLSARRVEVADALLRPAATLRPAELAAVTIPDIVLRGAGDNEAGGLWPSEAAAFLFDHIARNASEAAGQAGFFDGMSPEALAAMRQDLAPPGGLLENAVDTVKRDVGALTDGIRALIAPSEQAPAPAPPAPAAR